MSHLSCVTPHPYPVNPMNPVTTNHPLIYVPQDIFCTTNETSKIREICEIRVQKYYSNNPCAKNAIDSSSKCHR